MCSNIFVYVVMYFLCGEVSVSYTPRRVFSADNFYVLQKTKMRSSSFALGIVMAVLAFSASANGKRLGGMQVCSRMLIKLHVTGTIHTYKCICIFIYIHVYIHVRTKMCVNVSTCIHIHT